MNYLLTRLSPREQRILAYVCIALIVILPLEYYYSSSYGILMTTLAGSPIYIDLLPASYWMGTAMTAVAWLFCIWYVVQMTRVKFSPTTRTKKLANRTPQLRNIKF